MTIDGEILAKKKCMESGLSYCIYCGWKEVLRESLIYSHTITKNYILQQQKSIFVGQNTDRESHRQAKKERERWGFVITGSPSSSSVEREVRCVHAKERERSSSLLFVHTMRLEHSSSSCRSRRRMMLRMKNNIVQQQAVVLVLLLLYTTATWHVQAQLIIPFPDSVAPSAAPLTEETPAPAPATPTPIAATPAPSAAPVVNATLAPATPIPVINATLAPVVTTTPAPTPATTVVNATLAPVVNVTEPPVTIAPNATIAPTPTPIPIFPICNICGNDLIVTNPDGIYLDTSCELLQELGISGQLSETQCINIIPEVQVPCACAVNGTAPTTTPPPPTSPPIVDVDYTITGQVDAVLYSVSSFMSPSQRLKFEQDLALFYTDNPPDTFHTYSNWTTKLIEQKQLEPTAPSAARNRRLGGDIIYSEQHDYTHRDLQQDALFPLETVSVITAWVDGGYDNVTLNFNQTLQETLQNNNTGFIALLQTVDSISNEQYFQTVETIETQEVDGGPPGTTTLAPSSAPTTIADKGEVPAPAPAPSGDSGGLSTGAIAGIVVGVLVVIIVILVFIKTRNDQGRDGADADGVAVAGAGTLDEEIGGKNKSSTGAAAAAAVSTKKSSSSAPPGVSVSRTEESDAASSKKVKVPVSMIPEPTPEPVKKYKIREVMAPAGKLGLILDTIEGKGPVVHRVNDTSPLKHLVFEGDLIIAIDGIDTRPLNASAITGLMVKTAGNQRRLTIESEDTS